jgi:hypothetical protein
VLRPAREPDAHLAEDKVQPEERAVLLPGRAGPIAVGGGSFDLTPGLLQGSIIEAQTDRFVVGHVSGRSDDDALEEQVELLVAGSTKEDVEPGEVFEGDSSGTPEIAGDAVAGKREDESETEQQEVLLTGLGEDAREEPVEERAEAGSIELVHGDQSAVKLDVGIHHFTKERLPCFV